MSEPTERDRRLDHWGAVPGQLAAWSLNVPTDEETLVATTAEQWSLFDPQTEGSQR